MIKETAGDVNLTLLSNDDLIAKTKSLRSREARTTALLCAHLAEVNRRGLHLEYASNLYSYCAKYLGLTDGEAAVRVQVAKKGSDYPQLIRAMADGTVSLTVAAKLCPYLDRVDPNRLLEECRELSKRQVEEHLVKYAPKPLFTESVRAVASSSAKDNGATQQTLPLARAASPQVPGPTPATCRQKAVDHLPAISPPPQGKKRKSEAKPATPLAYNFRFSASKGFKRKIDRLGELVCKNPAASLEEVLEYALDYTLKNKDPQQRKQRRDRRHNPGKDRPDDVAEKNDGPAPASRDTEPSPSHGTLESLQGPVANRRALPREVVDDVYARAAYQCEHRSKDRGRCGERAALEVDHIRPLAFGGTSAMDNLQCLCRTHHRMKTQNEMGKDFIAGKIAARKNSPEKTSLAG